MIKVIKNEADAANRTYVQHCVNCKSVFTYQEEDIKERIFSLVGTVTCPVCSIPDRAERQLQE